MGVEWGGSGTWRRLAAGPGLLRITTGVVAGVAGAAAIAPVAKGFPVPGALFVIPVAIAAFIGWLWAGLAAFAASITALLVILEGADQSAGVISGVTLLAVALLISSEEAARASARDARERLLFLAEANRTLAASLDLGETLAGLFRSVVPGLADAAVVHVRTDQGVLTRHAEHGDLPASVLDRWEPRAPDHPVARVIATGRPSLLGSIRPDLSGGEAHPIRSAMSVPLAGVGHPVGALTLLSGRRRYDRSDLALAQELAATTASAIEHARLHGERSRVARTLQASLLPPDLPEIPGLDVAVRYRAAGEGNLVGGDFYDVFEVGTDSWAVALGDVCGKGPEAAALTGLVRHTIRATVAREASPRTVLSMVNDQIMGEGTDRFCTVSLGRIERSNGQVRLTISCGGHPPPLVFRPAGAVEAADCLGTLLGVFPHPRLVDHPVELAPGDAVVFYTDGVTERFERAGTAGDARLVSILWSSAELDAAGIADRIYADATGAWSEQPRDDIAIVVLKRPGGRG
jgi:serine phosphatase RsbU (regulator of sigma subunit)